MNSWIRVKIVFSYRELHHAIDLAISLDKTMTWRGNDV